MRKVLIAASILASFLCGTAAGAAVKSAPDPSPGTVVGEAAATAASKAAPAAKPAKPQLSAGTWQVGTEVKPGTYTTTAKDSPCYWARLKGFDGELTSIIANGNLDDQQHGRLTVKATDKGLELSGDCVWVRA